MTRAQKSRAVQISDKKISALADGYLIFLFSYQNLAI